MLGKKLSNNFRTWIEVDKRAAKKNYTTFRKLIAPKTKLWSVVKSNAYGHGLYVFAKLAQSLGVDGFCVDSLSEGLRLRKEGIRKPILVLGPTLPVLFPEAAKNKITVSISSFEALKALKMLVAKKATSKSGMQEFHLKIDTGIHRQGFYVDDLPKVIKQIAPKQNKFARERAKGRSQNVYDSRLAPSASLKGLYTHFASAKDINYPTYTEGQFQKFQKAIKLFENAGFVNLIKHCAATGGTLVDPKYHLDAVRVGIGLYGLWPSKELEMQLSRKINLKPILSWHTIISEIKNLNAGDYVGYDLVERARKDTKIAILPIGYWHGFPRSLSGVGEVLINGKRAKVLGRVSMDLLVVDAGGIGCRPGDTAVMIGKNGGDEILAAEIAAKAGTIHYEFLTRLNPLIERVVV